MPEPPLTIRSILAKTAAFFEQKGSPSARLDAEVLLAETLSTQRLNLYLDMERPLTDGEVAAYREFVRRRGALEPVAYIIGYREFRSMPFAVDRRTLIPRPETEGVVDLALAALDGQENPAILDVGTGSGVLAISLAAEIEQGRIHATDSSTDALAVARENAARLGFGARIEFVHGDLFAGLEGPFDLIVSNPPYVAESDRATLPRDVVEYEPAEALFAGPDGLAVIQRLLAEAPERLCPGGKVIFEIGEGQAGPVEALIRHSPELTFFNVAPDLRGIPRVAAAEKH
jgi:release factor glutamine methyltransferase